MTRSKGLLPLALPDTGIGESAGKRPGKSRLKTAGQPPGPFTWLLQMICQSVPYAAGTSVVSPSLLFAVGCVWCCLSGSVSGPSGSNLLWSCCLLVSGCWLCGFLCLGLSLVVLWCSWAVLPVQWHGVVWWSVGGFACPIGWRLFWSCCGLMVVVATLVFGTAWFLAAVFVQLFWLWVFLFSKLVLLLLLFKGACSFFSKESVPSAWICLYI